ncbi:transposable element Tcb1 transposase [Trichonephila clavipes]|nr:transposable element Tcb1 transposase [Trichonephila clavipes]
MVSGRHPPLTISLPSPADFLFVAGMCSWAEWGVAEFDRGDNRQRDRDDKSTENRRSKPLLVGVMHKNSDEGCAVERNEKRQEETTSGCFYPRSNHWEVGGRPQCDKCGCRVRNCSQHHFTTLETISNYRNSYPGFSSGRPRGTTSADDRYIVLQARRNRRQTAGQIARHTTQATRRPISGFTVARRLHDGGLFARRPVRCVPLTPAHRRRRSLWCREHRNCRDNEWGRVLFTDESRFSLSSDSHRILIRRERGSRNHPSNIIERDRYGGRGVLVLGGIILGSRTDLHIFDAGSVNGTLYCNEILLPYVRLFRGAMGLQFL